MTENRNTRNPTLDIFNPSIFWCRCLLLTLVAIYCGGCQVYLVPEIDRPKITIEPVRVNLGKYDWSQNTESKDIDSCETENSELNQAESSEKLAIYQNLILGDLKELSIEDFALLDQFLIDVKNDIESLRPFVVLHLDKLVRNQICEQIDLEIKNLSSVKAPIQNMVDKNAATKFQLTFLDGKIENTQELYDACLLSIESLGPYAAPAIDSLQCNYFDNNQNLPTSFTPHLELAWLTMVVEEIRTRKTSKLGNEKFSNVEFSKNLSNFYQSRKAVYAKLNSIAATVNSRKEVFVDRQTRNTNELEYKLKLLEGGLIPLYPILSEIDTYRELGVFHTDLLAQSYTEYFKLLLSTMQIDSGGP